MIEYDENSEFYRAGNKYKEYCKYRTKSDRIQNLTNIVQTFHVES